MEEDTSAKVKPPPRRAAITRRELLRRSSGLTLPLIISGEAAAAATAPAPTSAPGNDVYASIGVRPFINARGTYTILSGSLMLPEVRAAMDAASRRYVHLHELNDAIGARLAELTGAEWGLVTSGCAAALTHATAACVAGGSPDLHVRLPNLSGFAKDEVIIPKHSRNVYDAALRAVGVRVVEVATVDELESALGPRTALVYIFAGPNAERGPLTTRVIAESANRRHVPVLVDAAAEILTVPNVHLQAGAALVGYSGGKCLRGPQSAGLLLGRKDLVRAAAVHAAPHHGFARSMKVGKEEAIGMLAAVEAWLKRDHDAEGKQWAAWLDQIARRVASIDGVSTAVLPPEGLSNRTPTLEVYWDPARLGVDGDAVSREMFDGEPRIALNPTETARVGMTGVSITPYMLSAGDATVLADALHARLQGRARPPLAPSAVPAADLSGTWEVALEFAAGASTHHLHLRQQGGRLDGSHQGDFISRELSGTVDGRSVQIESRYTEENGDALTFRFTGTIAGDAMSGDLDMGEYRQARWTARRRTHV
jgi:L-seryl-tRNA(Ser) seleniumtransferase